MSLSFAITRCRNIGKRHAEQIQAVGELIAVCDIVRILDKIGETFLHFSECTNANK